MNYIEKLVHDLVSEHGKDRENLLPILNAVVDQEKFLSEEAILKISKEMDISAADVYGTASFYSFLDTQERGKYVIRICKTITCSMKGKNQIIQAIENFLKIKLGETTEDNKFTLLQTNCLGLCHKAPAMLVNHDIHTNLTKESVIDILRDYKAAK
ncbi:MAG: NAD(P)H-dependent oxidoreductase subunit E [Marinifilaceae bacterium]|nr:NAD(P)H-dependent oxidoreductase subunit E [Marinifilaceae bacterium]